MTSNYSLSPRLSSCLSRLSLTPIPGVNYQWRFRYLVHKLRE